jgi:multidrug transporter EmrE-like cation transporter
MRYLWPIALVVLSNTAYQICAKGTPADVDPLAALTVTYLVAAIASFVLYHVLARGGSITTEYAHLNWAPFVLGIVIVGLEVGMIYTYRVGWPVSVAPTVQGAFLAISLLFVGLLLYGEPITVTKVAGLAVCLLGIWLINR